MFFVGFWNTACGLDLVSLQPHLLQLQELSNWQLRLERIYRTGARWRCMMAPTPLALYCAPNTQIAQGMFFRNLLGISQPRGVCKVLFEVCTVSG